MNPRAFLDGKITVRAGDCLEVIRTLADCSVDACVTDPPYALVNNSGSRSPLPGQYTPIGKPKEPRGGFMGQKWDTGDVAFSVELWAEVFRVLKPGGHVLAFGGTRTYHRLACAIEDAGFEIRDQIGFAFGTGFPKSHDVSKSIDRMAGAEREVVGFNEAAFAKRNQRRARDDEPALEGGFNDGDNGATITAPATPEAIRWQGWGTALKPAWEPICVARKPLSEGTVAANVLRWSVGALNIDGCRVAADWTSDPTARGWQGGNSKQAASVDFGAGGKDRVSHPSSLGRWPANLLHDGSDEVVAAFPESGPPCGSAKKTASQGTIASPNSRPGSNAAYVGDSGSAARFFYCAKADSDDRLGSKHPTVKPVDLMQWLVRLVTPRGGTVLDCFAGTGTTGEAAFREGCRAILIEREPDYLADIERRMGLVLSGPVERSHAIIKAKGRVEEPGPLFV